MHPTLLNEYQSQITEIFSRKSVEIDDSQINFFNRLSSELNIKPESTNIHNIPMNKFVKNAILENAIEATEKGTRTEQINEQVSNIRNEIERAKEQMNNRDENDGNENR